MEETTVIILDTTFECEFTYDPGEKASSDCPESPENIDLLSAKVGGNECVDLLSDSLKAEIVAEIKHQGEARRGEQMVEAHLDKQEY